MMKTWHKKMPSRLTDTRAFTLIEIAMVTIIAGVIILSLTKLYDTWYDRYRYMITEQRIERLKEAIETFVKTEGRLPCVAPLDAPISSDDFGMETDCNGAPPSGTYSANGRENLDVRIGAIPTRTLRDLTVGSKIPGAPVDDEVFVLNDISDEYAFDGWGRRFTFAVTGIMAASEIGYDNNRGAISIVDANDNTLTPELPESGLYVIVSHGDDGRGGHIDETGVLYENCRNIGADSENCDYVSGVNDNIFRFTLVRNLSEGGDYYDDVVDFGLKELINIPAIADFQVDKLNCYVSQGYQNDMFNQRCATHQFRLSEARVNIGSGEQPSQGIPLFVSEITAGVGPLIEDPFIITGVTKGTAYIRATIPFRVHNSYQWGPPLMAAMYVDNIKIADGEIINLMRLGGNSNGGTGVVLGRFTGLDEGQDYDLQIYLYHTCETPDESKCGREDARAVAGTIKLGDHYVDGVVEIMQSAKDL